MLLILLPERPTIVLISTRSAAIQSKCHLIAMQPINNAIYLRRRGKICLPDTAHATRLPLNYVASVLKNVEALGFTFSKPLIRACRALTLEQLAALNRELIADLSRAVGAHRQHQPMYPNFPEQVMAMSECRLYINAIVHYLSDGKRGDEGHRPGYA
jgi:hypothetical protein